MASQVAQRFGHTLPHEFAGVSDESGKQGDRFDGLELAERGSDDGTDVLVRVAEMTHQGWDDRGTDRFQDQWQLVTLLLGQQWDRAATPAGA